MPIKMSELIKQQNDVIRKETGMVREEKKPIAEGFFSKLKSLFGSKGDKKLKKLKKDKTFMGHVNSLNKNWDDLAKMIEKDYGQKVNFKKFNANDFL